MASYKIIAGDFPNGAYLDDYTVRWGKDRYNLAGRNSSNVESVQMVTEENKKKFAGAAGWGLVGAVAMGPLGALAGVLVGGNKKEVCAAVYLKDGRKFMVVVDQKMYKNLVALGF